MSIINKVTSVLPGKGANQQYYLALLITYQGVTVSVWDVEDNRLKILNIASVPFGGDGNILETAADAIDGACEKLQIDTQDVILGLPDSWISNNQILPQYFERLKSLASDLDIVPFAFVALNHAVTNRLKIQYGSLITGYVLNIDNGNITLSSINGGHIVQSRFIHTVDTDITASIQKLFAHFNDTPVAGNAVYVYGPNSMPSVESAISNLGLFAQNKPKVIQLAEDYAIHSVSLAGAVDRGNTLGIRVEDSADTTAPAVVPPVAVPDVKPPLEEHQNIEPAVLPELQATAAPAPVPETVPSVVTPPATLPTGFVAGADIEQTQPPHVQTMQTVEEPIEEQEPETQVAKPSSHKEPEVHTPEHHAIPQHAIAINPPPAPMPAPAMPTPVAPAPQPAPMPPVHPMMQAAPVDQETPEMPGTKKPKVNFTMPISLFGSALGKVKMFVPKKSTPKVAIPVNPLRGKGILLLGPIFALILLLVGAGVLVSTMPKAMVSVTFNPKSLEGDSAITVSTGQTAVNAASAQVPGHEVSVEVSGEEKGTATGKKKVGDKAKGSITMYNKTAQAKSFPRGTTVTAGNISFVLDEPVTVPERTATESADREVVIKPGKQTVNVTAADIGQEANIASGTNMLIKGFSKDLYDASASTTFSGGTSRDVTVVSDDDIKRAQDTLTATLKEQAKNDITTKSDGTQKIVDDSIIVSITKRSTSKNVGDEAKEFTLTATATAKATAFSDSDLQTLLSDTVKNQIPDGYVLADQGTQFSQQVKKVEKNGDIAMDIHYTVMLTPSVQLDTVRKEIAGKPLDAAKTQLESIPNVSSVNISITPGAFGAFKRMPLKENQITIQTSTAQ